MNDKITWCRVAMNQDINKLIATVLKGRKNLRVLEISGHRWQVSGDNTHYERLNYPDFDICQQKPDGNYSFIVAEMVFEHLKYPYRAGKNIYETLEDEGWFLVSVPFLFPVHNHPIDCTRWTKVGLKFFLEEIGFNPEKIYTESWGNKDCLYDICEAQDHLAFHSPDKLMINDEDYPISVWGLAQK